MLACARAERFTTFAIRARRADKSFPLTSPELGALLGAAVVEEVGGRVDLDAPDLVITVEILPRTAYVSGAKRPGPGGLPVTISGRVTCLMSGGIDSPVAAYRMMQRGCRVDFVHFSGAPYTSRASVDKAHDLVEHLTRYQLRSDLWVVPFGEIQSEIVARVPRSHRVVLYRRMMLRIAEALGRGGAHVLVTGESSGQVSSQTLENMQTIAAATSTLVLRPLVGMDKNEIIQQADSHRHLRDLDPPRPGLLLAASRRRTRRRARPSPRSKRPSSCSTSRASSRRGWPGRPASASRSRRRSRRRGHDDGGVAPTHEPGPDGRRGATRRGTRARPRPALAVLVDGGVQAPHGVGTDRTGERAERGQHVGRLVREPPARQQDRVVRRDHVAIVRQDREAEGRDPSIGREGADDVDLGARDGRIHQRRVHAAAVAEPEPIGASRAPSIPDG